MADSDYIRQQIKFIVSEMERAKQLGDDAEFEKLHQMYESKKKKLKSIEGKMNKKSTVNRRAASELLDQAAEELDTKGYADLADEVDYWNNRIASATSEDLVFIAKSIRRIDVDVKSRDTDASLAKLASIRRKIQSKQATAEPVDEAKFLAALKEKLRAVKAQQTVAPVQPQKPQGPQKPGVKPPQPEQKPQDQNLQEKPGPKGQEPQGTPKEDETPKSVENQTVMLDADLDTELLDKFDSTCRKMALQRLLENFGDDAK